MGFEIVTCTAQELPDRLQAIVDRAAVTAITIVERTHINGVYLVGFTTP